MPSKCCIKQCRERHKDSKDMSYFELPAKPIEVRNLWVKNICIAIGEAYTEPPDWIFKDHTRLCSRHFEKSAINTYGMKRRLVPGSVPTIFEDIGQLQNPFSKRGTKPIPKFIKIKNTTAVHRTKNHDNINISTQSLLYEPAVILQEPSTSQHTQRRDVAVQVQVIDKSKPTPDLVRVQKQLRLEKVRNAKLEAEMKELRKYVKEPTPRSFFHKKLFTIVAASEKGDKNAETLLDQIKQFKENPSVSENKTVL